MDHYEVLISIYAISIFPDVPAPVIAPVTIVTSAPRVITVPIMSTNPYQMPIRGTANAPKFDGTIVDISQYFDDFDQHADSVNLTLKPRIKAALRYISRDDAETWETLPEASGDDYSAFVKAVKEQLYPGCNKKPNYSRSDLEFVVTEQAKKPSSRIYLVDH
jgi:hypothetical protein